MISVIVPVLNEEGVIQKTLEHLKNMGGDFETIVVDGGSNDKTVKIAKRYSNVVASKRGRAIQMNTGAGRARGEVLFFLHVDCMPEKQSFVEIEELMKDPRAVGGALRYYIDDGSLLYKNHVFWSNLRAGLTRIFLGDHGIFVRKSVFDKVGGYSSIPIMEDVALCKKLKKEGKLVQAKSKITSSSRRFKRQGFFRTVLQMWANRFFFFLGIPPEKIARYYVDVR
jgi:rSAM/selenodomain-associated transferase 2